MEPNVQAYTLRTKISKGQNKPLPCSHDIPQQMDHLRLKQSTSPWSSFFWSSHHLHLLHCFPRLQALSHFRQLSLHQSFQSGLSLSFHPSPSLLLHLSGFFTGGPSIDAHISRCLPLQNCSSEELTFKATMQDRAKVNIVGCSVTLPPADANLLAHLDLRCASVPTAVRVSYWHDGKVV